MSNPSNFKHVQHLGYTNEGEFEAIGLGSEYNSILSDLSKHGIPKTVIEQNRDFIVDFIKMAQRDGLHVANAKMGAIRSDGEPPIRPLPSLPQSESVAKVRVASEGLGTKKVYSN